MEPRRKSVTESEEKQWILVQKKTFTKWLNNHLRKKGFQQIEDPLTAFDTGIKMMESLNALFDVPIPKHNPHPKMRPHQVDNLNLAFKMLEQSGIKTNFLKITHLLDHDERFILGMLWSFILEYAIKGISVEEMTAKDGLLLWVQKKTKGYNHVDPPGVSNFSTSWKDGMALCALIHRHRPNLIDYNSLDPKDAASNLELAFSVAEQKLDIPRLLEVEDMTVPRPDERSVMTYVSEFFHRFAEEDIKENAARRLAKFLEFMRTVEQHQFDYESRARQLIQWAATQQQQFADAKLAENADGAVNDFVQLKDYLVNQKPKRIAEKLDVDALFAEIQTFLLVNNRKSYVPPDDCAPDAVQAAFDSLSAGEGKYAKNVRDNRFRFIEKVEYKVSQEKLDEINQAFDHFDKNHSNDLDKVEFKAALSALGVPFKDDEAYERVFAQVSQGNPKISRAQYMEFNMRLLEDKDTPEQLLTTFEMLSDQASTITAEQLHMPPLTNEDRDYLMSKMKDGDYKTFVAQSFRS